MFRVPFKFITTFISIFFILFFSKISQAGDNVQLKNEILQAINSGANYASDVLLDKNGKSRCDYHILQGKWQDYEPPWHTGQVIYALTRAFEVTRNPKYLKFARKAGDWWVGLEIKDNPKLNGMVRSIHQAGIHYIVFATMTDGAPGLFRLYKLTGDERYARVPTQAGKWMFAHMWEPKSRMFYDAVNPESGEVMKKWSPFWPEKKKQTLNDVARPNNEGSLFKYIYQYTKDEKYKKLFLELCESLVEKQGPEGLWMNFMPNDKESGSFHPRFPLWYAESLLEGYDMTGDKRYLEAAKKTAAVFANIQKKDGVIYYKNYLDGHANVYSISGSAVAFAGIVWLRLIQYGVGDEFKDNLQKSLSWILHNRYPANHPDSNLANGFIEIRSRIKKGKLLIYNRDIATSFGVRFLCDYYQANFQE